MRGILLVIGATLFWSLSGLFVRFVPEIDPWTMNAWRAGSMAAFLLLWFLLRHGRRSLDRFRRADPLGLALAAFFFAAGSTGYLLAFSLASVAAVSCLCATAPLFTAGLARFALGERTPRRVFLAIAIALAGVAIIASGEAAMVPTGLAGIAVALFVAFCFAGQSVALRRYRNTEMVPAIILGGFLCFLLIGLVRGFDPPPLYPLSLISLMGLVQLAIPLVLYIAAARLVPAVTMVLISLADAVLNPFWVWLVHGEVPAWPVYPGGALILGAIAFAVLGGQRRSGKNLIVGA